MSVGDYIVIGIVALLFVLAVISTVRYNRRGGCSVCCGDCSSCGKRKKDGDDKTGENK